MKIWLGVKPHISSTMNFYFKRNFDQKEDFKRLFFGGWPVNAHTLSNFFLGTNKCSIFEFPRVIFLAAFA